MQGVRVHRSARPRNKENTMNASTRIALAACIALAAAAYADNALPAPSKLIEQLQANREAVGAPLPAAAYSKLADQAQAAKAVTNADNGMYPAMCGHGKLAEHLKMLADAK